MTLIWEHLRVLEETYPEVRTALVFSNPFELLCATVLAAQTTDAQVNRLTPALFARFPTPAAMSAATVEELEELVCSVGLYRQKARSLSALSRLLVERHAGKVPSTLEELVRLPGVGRKTASVVLFEALGLPALPVDTHTARVAARLGWTASRDPVVVERDLSSQLPEELWGVTHQRLVYHGRAICTARRPRCEECPLSDLCPSSSTHLPQDA